MRIDLSEAEASYLLKKLKLDVEYYGTLAESAKVTPENMEKWVLVKGLTAKLLWQKRNSSLIKNGRLTTTK